MLSITLKGLSNFFQMQSNIDLNAAEEELSQRIGDSAFCKKQLSFSYLQFKEYPTGREAVNGKNVANQWTFSLWWGWG